MKVITNEDLISKRAKFARNISLISMALLLLGLLSTFLLPDWVLLSTTLVVLGFVGANIGAHNANRWLKEPRSDQILAKVLRGFDNHHRLYNYITAVPHVFLTPDGVFTFTVKAQDGHISCQGSKWGRDFDWRRLLRFFSEESLGNPTKDALAEAETLRKALAQLWSGDDVPEVQPVIVFINPLMSLETENPTVPAVTGKDLKAYIRQCRKEMSLPPEQRKELFRIFDEATA
jgi:hypothetical protein